MLADVFHWRQIRSAARREIKSRKANNASAPLSGKEGDDSVSPARSGERSEKALPKSTLYKGGIGQQRQPLKECVAKRQRCAES